MNMKTLVLFKYSVLFLCLCGVHLNGFAQSTREAILEDIARTGGVYYAYPVKEAIATPPPKGINRSISVIMHDTVPDGFNRNRIIRQWLIFSRKRIKPEL